MNRPLRSQHTIRDVAVPAALWSGADGVARGDCRFGDLVLRDGRVAGLAPPSGAAPRGLVLPRLTEAHVHLDKCHTVDRLADVGGDLTAAIAAQYDDKMHWTPDDIAARARRGLDELARAGCGAARSHVDWNAGQEVLRAPQAWEILAGLETELDLQLAALIGIEDIADPVLGPAIARRIAQDGGVLGLFVLDHGAARAPGIRAAFALAEQFGLALDFHVDEGLEPELDGLGIIADIALDTGFEGPILCGHACSLASQSDDAVKRVADKLARAGISVAALPATNLYLQGRTGGTPDRRGVTRLHELARAGVNMVIGTDNVRDAFCPIGRHDPVHSLALAVTGGHLDPPFDRWLPLITTNARSALGLAPQTVDGAAIGDLLMFDVNSTSELLSAQPMPRGLAEVMHGEIRDA